MTMYLYNLHTHRLGPEEIDGYKIRYILNTSPDEFSALSPVGDNVRFSCGIHPWFSDKSEDQLKQLRDIASDPRIVAIGEVGLDKLKGPELSIQTNVFRQQIEIALEFAKPIIIHCVKAWDELIALHKEYRAISGPAWIIHGYRGNPQQTKQLAKLGFKFSLGENFNKESLMFIPTDSIFCETDMSESSVCKVYSLLSLSLGVEFNHFALFVSRNMGFYSI